MTQKKPQWMPVDSWVDQLIRKAERQGAFEDLPGKGKPLPKVDTTDPAWWVKRKLVDEDLSLAMPPQLALRKEVEEALGSLRDLRTEAEVRERLEALNTRIRAVNKRAIAGPSTTLAPLDVERWVTRWRSQANPDAPEAS